jgi:uncharacterized protein YciI
VGGNPGAHSAGSEDGNALNGSHVIPIEEFTSNSLNSVKQCALAIPADVVACGQMTRSLSATLLLALGTMIPLGAQTKADNGPSSSQYVILVKRGANWIPGKGVSEQPLLKHGRYLKELMDKGTLVFAGPFLDDSPGLIGLVVLNASSETEARQIAEHDPGVVERILASEVRPFQIAFDAATGKSPFK